MPTSKEFTVPDATNPLSVRARAGSTAQRVAGGVMISVGSLTLPAAYYLLMVALCSGDCSGASQAERDSADSAREAILPVLFGGMATAAVGVALFLAGGTTLDVHSGEQARTPHGRVGRGFELTPTGFVF